MHRGPRGPHSIAYIARIREHPPGAANLALRGPYRNDLSKEMNTLFYGDNLHVLRQHIADASVDLVYLDPPFQSGKDYNVIFESHRGERGDERAQVEAFRDTWKWGRESEELYAEIAQAGGPIASALIALRSLLRESDLMAYVCMMAPRLVELRRVMKKTGSLYLHCDPTASHYLKVLLDAILGPACFRNEIIWRYRRWPAKSRRFQRMHDVLLFYAASPGNQQTFNVLYGYEKLADSTLRTFGTKRQKADFTSGHRKPSVEDSDTAGPPLSDHWDLEELEATGVPLSDSWEVGIIAPIGKERTGYDTQKPEKLLERVIRSSSNEGDVVLDPFCGCGTAIAVAEHWKRKWIGIDATHLAMSMVRARMADASFEVKGEPVDLDGAIRLASEDPYQFRWWILGRVGGRPSNQKKKKGADSGIDGELFFRDSPIGPAKRVVISVKCDTLQPADVREIAGAVEREGAAGGVLLTLHRSTQAMTAEAAKAGFVEPYLGRHPIIQIVTVEQVLEGRGIDVPGAHIAGLKKARRAPPRDGQRSAS
jgi:site-specific DNA-methyltransferase (adenine-specific)